MRTYIFIVLVIVAGIAAGLAIAVPRVSANFAEHRIAELVHAWTGQRVCVGGETKISVLPFPSVTVEEVEGRGCSEDMSRFKIGSLQASVRVLPLLGGWVEPHSLILRDAQIRVGWNAGSEGQKKLLSDLLGQIRDPFFADGQHNGVNEIILQNSAILFVDESVGRTEEITGINMTLALGAGEPLIQLAGTLEWRHRHIDLSLDLDDPQDLQRGGSRGQVTIAAKPAASTEDALGFLNVWSKPERRGRASQEEPKKSLTLLDPDRPIGPLRIAGVFKLTGGSGIAFEDATFELSSLSASGDLAFEQTDERPRLSGSLEFEELDLVSHLKAFVPDNLPELLELPVVPDELRGIDVDLAIRAARIGLERSGASHPDVRLRKSEEQITLALNEMAVAGGHLKGTLLVSTAAGVSSADLVARLDDISASDVARVFWPQPVSLPVGQDHPPEGLVTAAIDLSGRGETLGAIVASLEGWGVAMVRDGTLDGADIVPTLQRLATGDVDPGAGKPFIPIAGRTSFSILVASANIRGGVVHVPAIRFEGDRFEINMSGRGRLANGEIEAEGTATLHADNVPRRPQAPLVELPFGIGGTMREPMFAPGIPQTGALPTSSPAMPADGPDPIATLENARDVVR